MSVSWSAYANGTPNDFFSAAMADDGLAVVDVPMRIDRAQPPLTIPAGRRLIVESPATGPWQAIERAANVAALTFQGETVLTTAMAARNRLGSRTFRVRSTAGVRVGDYCRVSAQISQRRTGTFPNHVGDQVAMGFGGVVVGIGGDAVTLDNAAAWEFEPDRKLTYPARAGQRRFLYRVVRVAKSRVEVRVDGELKRETSDYMCATPGNSADLENDPDPEGIYFDFIAPMAGTETVEFRLKDDVPVVFERSGGLTMRRLRFLSDDGKGPRPIVTDRLKGSLYEDLEIFGRETPLNGGKPAFGGTQFFNIERYGARGRRWEMQGGGYGTFFVGGDFLLEDVRFLDCYEPQQGWQFAHGLRMLRHQSVNCATHCGGHGGHDIGGDDIAIVDSDMHIRSSRVNLSNVAAWGHATFDNKFSLGWGNVSPADERELANRRDNPAWQVQSKDYDISSSAVNWAIGAPADREPDLNLLPNNGVTLTNVHTGSHDFGTVRATGDGSKTMRVERIDADKVTARQLECRFARERVEVANSRLQDLRIGAQAGAGEGVEIRDTICDATKRVSGGDWVIFDNWVSRTAAPRTLINVTGIRPGATSLTSNSDPAVRALYTKSNVTLNGVSE